MRIVKINVTDLRSEPNFRAERINQAVLGDEVTVLEEKNEWVLIQLNDGYKGWNQSRHLLEVSRLKKFTHIVSGEIVNAYKKPDKNSEILTKIVFNTKLIVDKFQTNFACVELFTGQGWIDSNELMAMEEQKILSRNNIEEMIQVAKRFIGVPYLWGGKTPFGFDCSGFIQTLFNFFCLRIPRNTKEQIKMGREVKDLLPGDLIFFPRHVGIYCGNNEFIHASLSNGGVAISTLSGKFLAARRMICTT